VVADLLVHEDPSSHDPHYAIFTDSPRCRTTGGTWLSIAFSQHWESREWAGRRALVAESWPEEKRAEAAGHTAIAWAVGFFLAASFNLLLKGYGWRVMFVIGVLPALCRCWSAGM